MRAVPQDPERIFLWLDFAAVDQHAKAKVGLAALPSVTTRCSLLFTSDWRGLEACHMVVRSQCLL